MPEGMYVLNEKPSVLLNSDILIHLKDLYNKNITKNSGLKLQHIRHARMRDFLNT